MRLFFFSTPAPCCKSSQIQIIISETNIRRILMTDKIKTILSRWRTHPTIAENVVEWRVLAQKPASLLDYPAQLSPELGHFLSQKGISALYNPSGPGL